MKNYLIDTNVWSRIFKGNLELSAFVKDLESFIDATIYIECIQGSKSNKEKKKIEKYLKKIPLLPITPKISTLAISLIRQYSNSHGLLLPDALIAASALENDLAIVTYNIKDFKFIVELDCREPWV